MEIKFQPRGISSFEGERGRGRIEGRRGERETITINAASITVRRRKSMNVPVAKQWKPNFSGCWRGRRRRSVGGPRFVAKRGERPSFLLLSPVFRRLGRGFPRNIGSKPEQLRERARYWWKVRRSIRYATGCPGLIYGRVPAGHRVNLRLDCGMKWPEVGGKDASWQTC